MQGQPPALQDRQRRTLVLGIGNVLWADEGFGVRCVEALEQRYVFPEQVSLVDGGTQGLYLVPYVQSADRLLIFDAIDYGLEPGSLHLVRNADVPRFMGAKKLSLHQTGFQEVLSLAELLGGYPEEVLLIGCQPETLEDFGGSLSPVVRQTLSRALALGVEQLAAWGVPPSPRTAADALQLSAARAALDLAPYEAGRPDESQAERRGDPRFMSQAQMPPTVEHG
ncbi:MAG: hypothetical protein RL385_880 [Pseudomonadota bacterium]|jgi:hydrogenase maturation protease